MKKVFVQGEATDPAGEPVLSPLLRQLAQPIRIALYSHDTMGLGHKRRNLLLAQSLSRSLPQASILLISGMEEGRSSHLPANVDYLALPALYKDGQGDYHPRRLRLPLQALIAIRSQVIQSAMQAFAPDLFIVDNVPRGAMRELNPTLDFLRSQSQTRCVLGLRDVLDEPSRVQQEWLRSLNETAISQYYDAVWVYGDPNVFNLVQAYRFSATLASKVRYTGYFDQRQRLQDLATPNFTIEQLQLPPGKLALCLVGGGQDGVQLAQQFAQAQLPPDTNGIILTGPLMAMEQRQKLRDYAISQPRLRVLDYLEEPTQLLQQADSVVSMGGYNTVCELLSFGKRSLIVPRVTPRLEQWIRAERLRELGWVDVLHPDHLSAATISQWLVQAPLNGTKPHSPIDLNGLDRLPELVLDVLNRSPIVADTPTYYAS